MEEILCLSITGLIAFVAFFFFFLIKLDKGFFNKQEILELWHSPYN